MNGLHYSDGGKKLSALLLKCNALSVGLSLYIRFATYVKAAYYFLKHLFQSFFPPNHSHFFETKGRE